MGSKEQQKTKKISPQAQRILDVVVTAIEALVVVVCVIVSITVFVGVSDSTKRSINWFAIQTDSMMSLTDDNMEPGDLVFTKKPKSQEEIEVGTIIAFYTEIRVDGGYAKEIIIHRVVGYENGVYHTAGDNVKYTEEQPYDTYDPTYSDIVGVYHGKKAKGLGRVVLWLGGYTYEPEANSGKNVDPSLLGGYGYQAPKANSKTYRFLVIVIPLALLFVYNGYVVAKWVMDERAKKIREAALAEAKASAASSENEEEIKRAALVEFMKAQGMTDEQIGAYFAQQAAVVAAEEQKEEPVADEQPEQDPFADEQSAKDTADKPEDTQD